MNVVKTSGGKFIELQGTAETEPFDREQLGVLLSLADKGIDELIARQREIVGAFLA